MAMRQEIADFLRAELQIELSMEKTKVTHITEGFKFLGFWIERSVGQSGKSVPKIRIPKEALEAVRYKVYTALAPGTHQDSVRIKIMALNRIIRGWCGYYQYTSSPSIYFDRLGYEVFWPMAHWLGRKYRVSIPIVMRRFYEKSTFVTGTLRLVRPGEYKTKRYRVTSKPNPYLENPTNLQREEHFSLEEIWSGQERDTGTNDLKEIIYLRDNGRCGICGKEASRNEAELDHKRPRASFKNPKDADNQSNLWILHREPCHQKKTKKDLQVLSRMR
jgi:5-methylcytosine-specific restriction endonuclease McrA